MSNPNLLNPVADQFTIPAREDLPSAVEFVRGDKFPGYEALRQSVAETEGGEFRLKALDQIVSYVGQIEIADENGELLRPFEGTASVVVLNTSGNLLAVAKNRSEHLEDTMGYGDLTRYAAIKALQVLNVAGQTDIQPVATTNPEVRQHLADILGRPGFVGAVEAGDFVVGVSGAELREDFIRQMFPDEEFDFAEDKHLKERGAGLADEVYARLVAGALLEDRAPSGEPMSIKEFDPEFIAALEAALGDGAID